GGRKPLIRRPPSSAAIWLALASVLTAFAGAPHAASGLEALGTPIAAASPYQLTLAQQKIRHLVFIVQENRSFDHYFGTYPGANGIPMGNGRLTVCLPDPVLGHCARPYHSTSLYQDGAKHDHPASVADVDGG